MTVSADEPPRPSSRVVTAAICRTWSSGCPTSRAICCCVCGETTVTSPLVPGTTRPTAARAVVAIDSTGSSGVAAVDPDDDRPGGTLDRHATGEPDRQGALTGLAPTTAKWPSA